jgi:hypothetical protein
MKKNEKQTKLLNLIKVGTKRAKKAGVKTVKVTVK